MTRGGRGDGFPGWYVAVMVLARLLWWGWWLGLVVLCVAGVVD